MATHKGLEALGAGSSLPGPQSSGRCSFVAGHGWQSCWVESRQWAWAWLLEQEWRDDDVALVLHDAEGRHSPCVRLRSEVMPVCEAYLDSGGKKLVDLYRAINARSVTVASEWLTDADEPESLVSG